MKRYLTIGLIAAACSLVASADSLAERQLQQRARIHQGVENGSLTRGEAAHLRGEARQLHRQVTRNRADGGGLTAAERARLQGNANQNSRAIRRLNNNDRTR